MYDELLDEATRQLRAIGLDDESAALRARLILRTLAPSPDEAPVGHGAFGYRASSSTVWIGDRLVNVTTTINHQGHELRIERGADVETDEAPPDEEERRADLREMVASVMAAREEREALALMAARYRDKLEAVARSVLGADDKSLPIVRDALRRYVDDLAASTTVFSSTTPSRSNHRTVWPDSYLDDGLPSWDAALARFIEANNGHPDAAKLVRAKGAERAADGTMFAAWFDDADGTPPALRTLAKAFREQIAQCVEAPPLRITGGTARGEPDRFVKMPKPIAAVSWAMGAEGVRVDGDAYAQEPKLVDALLPKTWQLLPKDHDTRPHQTAWPMATDGNEPEPFAVALASSAGASKLQRIMGTEAAKIALLVLADPQVQKAGLTRAQLGQLTRMVRPGAKRIQPRDYVATASALEELKGLHTFLPDWRKVQIFDVTTPFTPKAARGDMEILAGITGTFREVLARARDRQLTGPNLRGNEFAGWFLVNIDGVMRLPNTEPHLLRLYVRAAATINAAFHLDGAGFDSSKLSGYTIDRWAALANALPHGVAEHLQAKSKSRSRIVEATKARRALRDDLDALRDEYQLVRIEKVGDKYKLLPTEGHLEAWQVMRAKGTERVSLLPDEE